MNELQYMETQRDSAVKAYKKAYAVLSKQLPVERDARVPAPIVALERRFLRYIDNLGRKIDRLNDLSKVNYGYID